MCRQREMPKKGNLLYNWKGDGKRQHANQTNYTMTTPTFTFQSIRQSHSRVLAYSLSIFKQYAFFEGKLPRTHTSLPTLFMLSSNSFLVQTQTKSSLFTLSLRSCSSSHVISTSVVTRIPNSTLSFPFTLYVWEEDRWFLRPERSREKMTGVGTSVEWWFTGVGYE